MVQGIIASGRETVFRSREGVEDVESAGVNMASAGVAARDVVVGIAASRRTPYVLSALAEGQAPRRAPVFVCCNDGADGVVVITVIRGRKRSPAPRA